MISRQEAFAATVAVPNPHDAPTSVPSSTDLAARSSGSLPVSGTQSPRSAVLPRAGRPDDGACDERYAKKRVLGAGGMGEVVLAEDRDIGRHVAVKYLTAPSDDAAALARFVDEIRVVGSLEHPNIVPIHDVGLDGANRYYFVMKHVEGETLEQIIEKLAAGDRAYHQRYTYTARVQIFVALLRALAFAHARGYVHRDIKPANVMIGRYGEVMLMDWGIAKRCKEPEAPAPDAGVEDETRPLRERLFTTRRGAIVGTPVYMSPEQARGEVDAIDERSDVYCATALFYELVTLRHYLGDRDSLADVLRAIQSDDPPLWFGSLAHPTQGPPPAEFVHFAKRGLKKDPTARWQSVTEMVDFLEDALDGRVHVQCPFTLQKRMTGELTRFADRHPLLAMATFLSSGLAFVGALGWAAWEMVLTLHAR
jgi:eukaryotic-like serine/threonine-protein kinase